MKQLWPQFPNTHSVGINGCDSKYVCLVWLADAVQKNQHFHEIFVRVVQITATPGGRVAVLVGVSTSGYLLRITPNIHFYSTQQHSSVHFLLSCSVKLEDVCLPLELFSSPETVRNSSTSEATWTLLTVGRGCVFVVWLKPDVIASFTRRNDSTLLNEGDLLLPAPFIKLSPHK